MNTEIKKIKKPPVVVVLGHVDHGKTSLLDYIRKTKIVEKEAGLITQSTGAYEVIHYPVVNKEQPTTEEQLENSKQGERITFIDTPGHEAFWAMRQRGADIADIAILVVSADEGIKPQTEESIKILIETKTPYIVVITKADLPTANIQKVKSELMAKGVLLEGLGGDISWQVVSSKTGEGINELLDLILLLRDVLGLNCDLSLNGRGFIIESKMDSQRGIMASVILRNGVLRLEENIFTLTASGKIKNLERFLGKPEKEIFPSSPAVIFGFEELPKPGEEFRTGKIEILELGVVEKIDVSILKEASKKELLPVAILKADVAGSLEVLTSVLGDKLKIIGSSVGEITDGDINSAIASQALIVGFKTKLNKRSESFAGIHNVKIFISEVIYELVKAVEKHLAEIISFEMSGRLRVIAVFGKKGDQQIIGGRVFEGVLKTNRKIEITRGSSVIGEGKIINLQENKEDMKEVGLDKECGILIDSKTIIREGDEISQRAS